MGTSKIVLENSRAYQTYNLKVTNLFFVPT